MPNRIPLGTIMPFSGNLGDQATAQQLRNAGWLPCDGQLVAIADYPELDSVIDNHYGGDGQTTIGLPDLRGRFIRGMGYREQVGKVLPSATALPQSGTFKLDDGGEHTHIADHVPLWSNTSCQCAGHENARWNSGSGNSGSASATHTHTIEKGGDKESRPANLYLFFVIKAKDVGP